MFLPTTTLRRFLIGLTTGLLASLAPLHAQLDPRLQGTCSDFLDLFQQSNSLTVMKPEIVTMFDFTGSMSNVMPPPGFVNNDLGDSQGSDKGFTFTLTSKGNDANGTPRYDCKASVNLTQSSGYGYPSVSMSLSGGILVRPDGSTLAFTSLTDTTTASGDLAIKQNYNPVNPFDPGLPTLPGYGEKNASNVTITSADNPQKDVRNWMRCASHVRFTYGGKTFDIPICWTVLNSSTVVYNAGAGEYRNQYLTYPLRCTFKDPASGVEQEIDRSYRVTASSVFGSGAYGATSATISSSFAGWRPWWVNWIWTSGTIPQATSAAGYAFANGIPGRTRTQALKEACALVWGKYYSKVFWAFRFINDSVGSSGTYEGDTGFYNISNDSRHDMSASNVATTGVVGGTQRQWVLLNGNSANALYRLASYKPGGATMLNYAMANTLAQYNDPNSVFNDVETGTDAPVECRKSFHILFTDGFPNNEIGNAGSIVSPYYNSSTLLGDASTGNQAVASNLSGNCMEPGVVVGGQSDQWLNIISLAGIAAHGQDNSLTNTIPLPTGGYPGTLTWPSGTTVQPFVPFAILQRGSPATVFKRPHLISTMTVGVMLAGGLTGGSPKQRLFIAAAVGDPDRTSWNINTLTPFTLVNPGNPSLGKTANSINFFDAANPTLLAQSLDYAFLQATLSSNINSTTNPNIPYVGASLGQQVYLGKFKPPVTGGAVWPGDVLMFATKEINNQTFMLDRNGNVANTLDATTAQWSASNALLNNRLFTGRNLYTRLPGTSGTPEPGLTAFSDAGYPSAAPYTTIKPYTATAQSTDAAKRTVIEFMMGADTGSATDAQGRFTANRSTIMGDVIDSSPQAVEYDWRDVSSSLTPVLSAVSGTGTKHFRLVLVGTNQGWLHAFGEVTVKNPVTDASGNQQVIVTGAADELWSFLPTDFLAKCDALTIATNPHRFMVDGTPTVYMLDLPPDAGGAADGIVQGQPHGDVSSSTYHERAIAIFGLGKGGRSYYAIDIHDPFHPTLLWSLVPDEAASFAIPAGRLGPGVNGATATTLVKNMGYSSCTPAAGRVLYNGVATDVIFFGGGYSEPTIEANFGGVKLGRSLLAVEASTGKILAAVDMLAVNAGIGPIPAGLVPFEFFLNSGMAQRAYFLDFYGGLWSWGSQQRATSVPYQDYRIDNSDLADWTSTGSAGGAAGIRLVAQDGSGGNNARYTTLPSPFRVGNFPGQPRTVGSAPPVAVGIAMESGNRNNPLDYCYNASNPAPTDYRLTVVFDRQDSYVWGLDSTGITDSKLVNFSGQNSASNPQIQPGSASYYLTNGGNPFFGYYLSFPGANSGFLPKGITQPAVVAGSLFFTYFNPLSADPCTGGSGSSFTNLVCDVYNPIVHDTRTGIACASGQVAVWSGVASDFSLFGTRGVLQAGTVPTGTNPPPGTGVSATQMQVNTFLGKSAERYPKVRVWRTTR